MSPAMLSTAKSSLTEPIGWFSGSSTHLVIGVVGNRAARGQRGQPRAAPAAQHAIDRVVMDERAAPAAPRAEAVGEHAQRPRRNPRASERDRARRGGPARRASSSSHSCAATSATICWREHVERLVGDRQPRRVRRDARCRAGPRIRPVRRATAGTAGPSACRRPRGPSARRAAGSSRSSAASRAGRRDRRRRYRCRAPARRSRPAPSARRASAAARRRAAAPWPCCRDAR